MLLNSAKDVVNAFNNSLECPIFPSFYRHAQEFATDLLFLILIAKILKTIWNFAIFLRKNDGFDKIKATILEFLKPRISIRKAADFFKELNLPAHRSYSPGDRTFIGLKNKEMKMINFSLYKLLTFVKNEEITLYGKKTSTTYKTVEIIAKDENFSPFYYKENWSDDLSCVYENGELLYAELFFYKSDFDEFIKQYDSHPKNMTRQ